MADIKDEISSVEKRSINERSRDFSALIKDIKNISDKKRQLWVEIYENAISDRQHSYLMFESLLKIVDEKSTEYAVHGKTLATFVEKMSRANDQLIKLAELIAAAEAKEDEINPDDMFDQISNAGRSKN